MAEKDPTPLAGTELSSREDETEPATRSEDRRVAVIAIHGVGRHPMGVSADAVATLLLSIGRNANSAQQEAGGRASEPYSGFVTTGVDVPLRPVLSPENDAKPANERTHGSFFARLWSFFDERRGFLAQTRDGKGEYPPGYEARELRPGEPDRGDYAYRFMITQLAGYKGEVDRDFQTVRLEGKRSEPGSEPATVHIYDAHYSDLSKPQSNIVAFFFAFYQLLFHLANLSLLAVYWTEAENVIADKVHRWRWRMVSSFKAAAVRLLTMAVPFLNAILLVIACSAFIDKARGKPWLPAVSLLIAGLLSLTATFCILRQKGSPSRPFLWASLPVLGTAAGMLALCGIARLCSARLQLGSGIFPLLLLLCWFIAAGLGMGFVTYRFDKLRPGAFWLSIILYACNVLWFVLRLLPGAARIEGANAFAVASLWAVQWIFGELLVSWILCLLCALISYALSIFCVSSIQPQAGESQAWATARRSRAIAAFRTSRFAFAIPAILFVIATCAIWSGVVVYGSDQLNAYDGVRQDVNNYGPFSFSLLRYIIPSTKPVVDRIHDVRNAGGAASQATPPPCCANPAPQNSPFWSDYLRGLLLVSVTPGLPITVLAFLGSLLLLTWAVLPSVIFEIWPEWTRGARSGRIQALGVWLSRGLDNVAILTRVLWCAIVPIPLLSFAIDWLFLHRSDWSWLRDLFWTHSWLASSLSQAETVTLRLIQWQGLALAVFGAAFFGFILKGLTSVLDAILDVDNYLRVSPLDETPRARIAERCTSLLRYIATRRDGQGRPYYSKLVIVAHSLGSMVTTDLLRYLERSGKDAPDPDLERYRFHYSRAAAGDAEKLRIYLFSMGCPLRQLLNRFFPHLYWWVSDVPDNSLAPLGNAVAPPPVIEQPVLPRSDEMNVAVWTNAYRSGDYIGRSLWVGQWLNRNAADNPAQPPDVAAHPAVPNCDEMCIGLGAHTHYWDRSAPEIGEWLDQLIRA